MRWFRFAWLLLAFHAAAASALEPFVIKDIRVEGIQRTEAGTVFTYLPVKVGDTMTEEKASQAIRALFATGFFRDVILEREGDVLVVVLQERPSIALIEFTGLHEFDKDQILNGLRQIGFAEGRIFDKSSLDRGEQELKRQYLTRGYYAVNINTTVTPLERNRVSLNFNIEEGRVAKIRQISIIGAKAFRESDLLKEFVLRPPGMLTWFSKQDQYSRQKLSADIESLRSYYLDRGYLEFSVDSTQVSITPDKQDIYITVSITEGRRYTVSDVKIAGEMLLPEAEVRKLILVKPGEVFSRARLTESNKLIADRLSNEGYAFANVNAVPELDREKLLASFTFFIDPGRRVYVRRINITGNHRTRDEVVRRELRQLEGGWYSGEKIARSKTRVDKLGYFQEVNLETPAVAGTTDQVDLNMVEKPTGVLLAGAGYGSEGILLQGSVTQQNIFGSGRHVGVSINTSEIQTIYSLSYTNPYFTVDGVSQGFDIYYRTVSPADFGLARYETETAGAALRLGVPVSEIDTINYSLGYENTAITTFADSPLIYQDYVETFGPENTNLFVTVSWARDQRDSLIYPTKGSLNRSGAEVGTPGGDLQYYKLSYQYQRYFPLTRNLVFLANGEVGYGDGYGDQPLPFFKNFTAGGISSVRGFKSYTIGPKDLSGAPRGGSQRLVANAELLFPFPGLENDRSVRLTTFLDMGYVGDKFDTADLRFSTGLGVHWISPLGPLRIMFGFPLRKKEGDSTQLIQFTVGGVF
jgi:outer membrane protein insertion porin family